MTYEAPTGPVETALAEIWLDVLDVDRVGRNDNFFELGGHSLQSVYMLERMRHVGLDGDLRALFASPILREMAANLNGGAAASTITRIARDQPLIPSFSQQRLWFLSQMEGFSDAYHIFLDLRLKGPLDEAALTRALNQIVARHEALRTTFYTEDGAMFQRIGPADTGLKLTSLDLSGTPDQKARLKLQIAEESAAPFDLENGPLIRGRLVRLGPDDHALLITVHHIVSDGWSVRVFMEELGALYRAGGETLPPLPVQYADYAAWQRQSISEDMAAELGAYWRRTLAGAPAMLELPTDRPRPPRQDFTGATLALEFDQDLTAQLKALARRHGITLFMTVLTGWALVLSRLSAQDDLVIGVPAANRDHLEIESLIGFFINTLALRIDFSGQPSVAALLERVKTAAVEAQAHQALPFEQVIDLVKPQRSLAHPPLFQVMFAWQSHESGSFDLPGLNVTRMRHEHEPAKFDLTLELREAQGRIRGGLNYATALFDQSTAERYAGYLRAALVEMAADDTKPAAALSLLSAEEQRKLLVDWNQTEAAYPDRACIHHLFEAQVARSPAAVAVVQSSTSLTYADLNTRANKLAHHLRGLGVKPDSPVAICVERSPDMVVGLLAILKAGGAYVPLDPAYPPERLGFMLQDSKPAIVLTDPGARASLDEALAATGITAKILDLKSDCGDWANQPGDNPTPDGLNPNHLAYMIYTSGSTGKPKGVMVSHGNGCNFQCSMAALLGINPDDRLLAVTSLSFDIAGLEIFLPLTLGASVFIATRAATMDGALLGNVLNRGRITVLQGTPSIWRLLKEADWKPQGDFIALCGGEAIPADVGLYLKSLPGKAFNLYGPTETTIWSMIAPIEKVPPGLDLHIGRPIWNTRIYLLDALGNPVPEGAAGEILIGGAGVTRGYHNRPDLTAERFIPSPFVAGDRLYKTGDLARYRHDGNVDFIGRNDFQVKVRGFRIELGEIEARLSTHPDVREAVALVREDEPGDKRLVGYYTSDEEIGAEALRAHLAETLPDYMIPAAYIALEVLPLTPNGKLDRKALPKPSGDAYGRGVYEEPAGAVEITLAKIWSEVLGVEKVGRNDNFFDLGGHSLLAVRMLEKMRRAGIRVDVRTIFASPVLAAMAASVPA